MPETPTIQGARPVAIRRIDPNALPLVFANDFAMTNTGSEVFLIFSQVQPPIDLKPEEVGTVKELPAVAVAKVAVSAALARAIIKVMEATLKQPTAKLT
jgi:hypothetical protein